MIDPIALHNARQSKFYEEAVGNGTYDRDDVTSGSGYSRFDYDQEEEDD